MKRAVRAHEVDISDSAKPAGVDPSMPPNVIDLRDPSGPDFGLGDLGTVPSTGDRLARGDSKGLYRRLQFGIAFTDTIAVLAGLLMAYYLRFETGTVPEGYLGLIILAPIMWLVIGRMYGIATPWRLSPVEEFQRIIGVAAIGTFGIVMASFWSKASFSRIWVGLTFALVVFFQLVFRFTWRKDIARLRSKGRLVLRTVIVGDNEEGGTVTDELDPAESGFAPIAMVSVEPVEDDEERCLGDLNDLERVIAITRADSIFVASSALTNTEMFRVLRAARRTGVTVHVSATLPELLSTRLSVQSIGRLTALSVSTPQLSGIQAFSKRVFDLIVGSIAFILALPVILLTAIAVRLDSPGPSFFHQQRVTKGGKLFRMFKFRTMYADADRILEEKGIDPSAPFFKLGEDDPRVTRVGRFIRRFSIDELPQLLNVLKGDMSLVGPRPLPADQVAAHLDLLGPRHEVPAGVTGWWQIKGRSDLDHEDAVKLDHFYIENWSPALDMYILMKTVGAVFRRKGAF